MFNIDYEQAAGVRREGALSTENSAGVQPVLHSLGMYRSVEKTHLLHFCIPYGMHPKSFISATLTTWLPPQSTLTSTNFDSAEKNVTKKFGKK
jgi:hypothetical protein